MQADTNDVTMMARHIDSADKRTTIALEQAFWRQADSYAETVGQSRQQWAAGMLEDRPSNIGKARWLRVRLLVGEC
jgi:predicted DNA-binding ribbon-helix-helix protein